MSVLVLGAGRVSGPLFEHLHKHGIRFSVVSSIESELQSVREKYPAAKCCCMDVTDFKLPTMISEHKLVICILPPEMMAKIATICIDQKRPMLTGSYVSAELRLLNQRAVDAGVLIMCECGVDPGLDHMLTMKVIHKVTSEGGQVTSVVTWCGGIPAPESRQNPLQYKFSWSPRTALLLLQRAASYLEHGKMVVISGSKVLDHTYPVDTRDLLTGVELEGLANKFDHAYLHLYGLEHVPNFFRGTLRYKGFSSAVKGLIQAGLFSEENLPLLQPNSPNISWRNVISHLVTGHPPDDHFENKLLERLENNSARFKALRGLGLLSTTIADKKGTPFDSLVAYLERTLSYGEGECDMIVMQNDIGHCPPSSNKRETTRASLVVFGDKGGHSAMAKTVGYPLGIIATMILKGQIKQTGIVIPIHPDVYKPVLSGLKDYKICPYVASLKSGWV